MRRRSVSVASVKFCRFRFLIFLIDHCQCSLIFPSMMPCYLKLSWLAAGESKMNVAIVELKSGVSTIWLDTWRSAGVNLPTDHEQVGDQRRLHKLAYILNRLLPRRMAFIGLSTPLFFLCSACLIDPIAKLFQGTDRGRKSARTNLLDSLTLRIRSGYCKFRSTLSMFGPHYMGPASSELVNISSEMSVAVHAVTA